MRHAHLRKLILLAGLLAGCGSQLNAARSTVALAGAAWMELDSRFAVNYEQARIEARESSESWEERDAKIERWESARKALIAAGHALKAAALSIAIAEDGHYSGWQKSVSRAFEALDAACSALETVGVDIPVAARKALELGKSTIADIGET